VGNKQQVPSRQYTDEFRVEAVRLGESIGGNQAAKRLGIPESSLWNWLRLNRAGKLKAMRGTSGPTKPGVCDLKAENERLRRELANTRMDLEIVKKAAAFFAKEGQSEGCRGDVRLD
jgi:transposase